MKYFYQSIIWWRKALEGAKLYWWGYGVPYKMSFLLDGILCIGEQIRGGLEICIISYIFSRILELWLLGKIAAELFYNNSERCLLYTSDAADE